jgi:hypothetical protein
MLRSLFFLLVMGFSLLMNIPGDAMPFDPASDDEMWWHRATAGKSMEEVVQKLSK